ncbi:MAG: response regulator [Bacteroidales bacterium]|nr:response regulator [Bacteroidales bacterium]
MKPLICIIDRNKVYRHVIQECLSTLGYSDIETFTHPDEALRSVRIPQIVILDTNGGDKHLSGIEFFRQYGHTRYRHTRFIFLSSDSSLSSAVSVLRMGAYDYILKSKAGLNRLVVRIEKLSLAYIKDQKHLASYRAALISMAGSILLLVWAVLKYS